jgi:hypothetical protein
MHERPQDLERLQQLLDETYASAGEHLRSIHTEGRRITAEQVCGLLRGVCVFDLATVSSRGRPVVAPIDGLFFRGELWFGSSQRSLRFRHIRANPEVSAAYTQGEAITLLLHGRAHEVDTGSGDHEPFHDFCREIYGDEYDSWGYWGKEPFAWLEPRRFYAAAMQPEALEKALASE